jgi:hypothetical protein
MAHLMVRHKVADFAKWKPVFDGHHPTREAAGLKDLHRIAPLRIRPSRAPR